MTFPNNPNDLVCDTCPARVPWMDAVAETIERARARGWHVYRGPSLTGTQISKTLCETCTNRGKPQRGNRNTVLPDQMDLFGATPVTLEPKKQRGARSGFTPQ